MWWPRGEEWDTNSKLQRPTSGLRGKMGWLGVANLGDPAFVACSGAARYLVFAGWESRWLS